MLVLFPTASLSLSVFLSPIFGLYKIDYSEIIRRCCKVVFAFTHCSSFLHMRLAHIINDARRKICIRQYYWIYFIHTTVYCDMKIAQFSPMFSIAAKIHCCYFYLLNFITPCKWHQNT